MDQVTMTILMLVVCFGLIDVYKRQPMWSIVFIYAGTIK